MIHIRSACFILLAASVLTLWSCNAPPKATTPSFLAASGDLAAAIGGARTVSLHPRARVVRPRPGQSNARLQNDMERALKSAFQARGYSIASEGGGERIIAYAIGIGGQMNDKELVRLFGISPGVDSPSGELRGGIVLAVIHQPTGRVLWRGSGSAAVAPSETDEQSQQIRRGVETILAGLPNLNR